MSSHMNAPARKDMMKKGRSNSTNNSRGSARSQNKTIPEGIYTNPRFLHTATSLIGSTVQIQVKNGTIYEGAFKTFSSKMEIVLEVAHKVEENWNGQSAAPSLERLNTVIFNIHDVVTMSAASVDLNYARRDNFTDSAISKHNGDITEQHLKELEPWQGEEDGGIYNLEDSSSNGWDPNDMFQRNAEKFNVQSTYDDSLDQYTTRLEVKNTKEYRQREHEARQLANEIENSENYHRHIDLENGDGDEEDKFSAVIRGGESGAPGKYVPPHMRSANPRGRSAGRGSPQGTPPRTSSIPNRPQMSPQNHPQPSSPMGENRLNGGEKLERRPDTNTEVQKSEALRNHASPPTVLKDDTKTSPNAPKIPTNVGRDPMLESELREFKTNFKLSSETKDKERENVESVEDGSSQPPAHQPSSQQPPLSPHTTSQPRQPSPTAGEKAEVEKLAPPAAKSTLNPDAPEFKFNPTAKPFVPGSFQRTNPTPPRVVQAPSPGPAPMYSYQPLQYQAPHYIMMPQGVPQQVQSMVPQSQPAPRMPKKDPISEQAIVSVRQDFGSTQAAAAATGPPLQMQPQTPQQYVQYTPQQMVPQAMQQQMSYPAPQIRHIFVPTSMQSGGNEQGNGHSPAVMMGPGGNPGVQPMPAHMQYPGNMAPHHHHHTPPHSQAGTPQNHPSPSPVQQHPHQQPHPPPSGTPQHNNIIYTQQAQQPPLQPSPHTPASPQAPHPPHMQQGYPYPYPAQSGSQTMGHPSQQVPQQAPQYIMMPHSQHPSQNQPMMQSPYQQHIQHGSYRAPSPQVAGQHSVMGHSAPSSGAGMHPQMHYIAPQHQMQGHVQQIPQNYHTHHTQ